MSKQPFTENDDSKLTAFYSTACEDIHAPRELYGKVMNMTEEKRTQGRMWKVAVITAVLAAVILATNVLTYAATGTGWIGRILVTMGSSNGTEMVFQELTDSSGRTYYFGNIQDEVTDIAIGISTYDPEVLKGKSFRVEGTKIIVIEADGSEHPVDGSKSDENGYTAVLAIPTYLPTDPRYSPEE